MGWSRWISLGQPTGVAFLDRPATVSRSPQFANVYVRGGDNALWQLAWDGAAWQPWARHEGSLSAAPTAASMTVDHEHVFVRGSDGLLYQKWWTAASGFSSWVKLGAPSVGFVGAPATVSRSSTFANVYVRGGDNALWQLPYDGSQWLPWIRHADGVLASEPAVGSNGPDHEHVFVRGTDGAVWQRWWTAHDSWSGWVSLGAPPGGFVGAPSTVSRSPTFANVYVRGNDNRLWQRAWTGKEWTEWLQPDEDGDVLALRLQLSSEPSPGSMLPTHEHVFARGADGALWQKAWIAAAPTVRFHIKMLVPPTPNSLVSMVDGMRQAFENSGILVKVVSSDNLSPPDLLPLLDVNVGGCTRGTSTANQNTLFSHPLANWSAWVPRGGPPGGIIGAPATVSRSAGFANVYARGADNALWQLAWDGERWSQWTRHDGALSSAPAVASAAPNHEHIFVRGVDGSIYQKWWTAETGFSGWVNVGAPAVGCVGAPATISRSAQFANIYVRGGDNALWQRPWSGAWGAWTRHEDGMVLASELAAGSMGPEHEHVFARGTDGAVWQKWWTASGGWSAWTSLGSPGAGFVGAPSVVSRDSTVCNIYVQGVDNMLWQRAWSGGAWGAWTSHSEGSAVTLSASPAPASMSPNHEHVFIRAADGTVWQKWWLGGVRASEMVIFIVRSTLPPFDGCAAHPAGQPGAVVARSATPWALGHEAGHVLGLSHISGEPACGTPSYQITQLMTSCFLGGVVNLPPDLSSSEASTISSSPLVVRT